MGPQSLKIVLAFGVGLAFIRPPHAVADFAEVDAGFDPISRASTSTAAPSLQQLDERALQSFVAAIQERAIDFCADGNSEYAKTTLRELKERLAEVQLELSKADATYIETRDRLSDFRKDPAAAAYFFNLYFAKDTV